MNGPARLLIAEDHRVLRDGLKASLDSYRSEFTVIGEAETGLTALKLVKSLRPDLALLDIRMPEATGMFVLEEAKRRVPCVKVIVFTQFQDEAYVRAALAAGAEGYFVKNDGLEALVGAMRDVLRGQYYLSPRVSHFLVDGYRSGSPEIAEKASWERLSTRERTIIKLIAEGKKNREIGTALALSTRSIETYRSDIMRKLRLSSTPALIRYAVEHDLA